MIRHGFSLVELMTALAIVAITAAFVVPSLTGPPRMSANETCAVGTLRAIVSAENVYFGRHKTYGTLAQLGKEGMIGSDLAGAAKDGYRFGQIETNLADSYCFAAAPVADGKGGDRKYCVTQRGVIFEGGFSTSGMRETSDTHWVPGKDNVSPTFTEEPERDKDNWTPVEP